MAPVHTREWVSVTETNAKKKITDMSEQAHREKNYRMQANCIIQSIGKQKDRVESGRETIIVFEREKKNGNENRQHFTELCSIWYRNVSRCRYKVKIYKNKTNKNEDQFKENEQEREKCKLLNEKNTHTHPQNVLLISDFSVFLVNFFFVRSFCF